VADPDRDALFVVDPREGRVLATLSLLAGDEPGRAVEDDAGRVHVVLRRGGAVVTVDLATRTIVARRAICPAPRGIAFVAEDKTLRVACAGGELMTLPAGGGPATDAVRLVRDLRDVVHVGGRTFVTTFRAAEVYELVGTSLVRKTVESPGRRPSAAYRAIATGKGALMVLHQLASDAVLSVDTQGGYGGARISGSPCDSTFTSGITSVAPDATSVRLAGLSSIVLPVDLAVDDVSGNVAVVTPANAKGDGRQVWVASGKLLDSCTGMAGSYAKGQIVAVAYLPTGELVVQSREPAFVQVDTKPAVTLSEVSREDTGHAIFHSNTGHTIACASCHPEGGDDALSWRVVGVTGPRRTQSVRGHVLSNAPFHWDGSVPSFDALVSNVFQHRMGGPFLTTAQRGALARWIDSVPALPPSPPASAEAAARGKALFADPAVGCAACHRGPRLSENTLVSTGSSTLRVPSLLGVAARSPFGHDGCGATLAGFLSGCGAAHGKGKALASETVGDLAAYLETL
jgi:mono/diheme cytochrome c family protein